MEQIRRKTMAQVIGGVPVYYRTDSPGRSLACLRDQTYRDIEVLVFDNYSGDAGGEIAQRTRAVPGICSR